MDGQDSAAALLGGDDRLPQQPARATQRARDERTVPVLRPGDAAPAERRRRRGGLLAEALERLGHRARGLPAGAGDLLGRPARRLARRCASRSARRCSRSSASACRPAKLGLMLGFQSGIGYAGREGLQPTDSWLEVVKLEALAAKAGRGRARHRRRSGRGAGGRSTRRAPTRTRPSRRARTCGRATPRSATCSNRSTAASTARLTEGQIDLAAGVQCTIGTSKAGVITAALDRLHAPHARAPGRARRAHDPLPPARPRTSRSCASAAPSRRSCSRASTASARATWRRSRGAAPRPTWAAPRSPTACGCRTSRAACTCRRRRPRPCARSARRTAARASAS